MHLYSAYHFTFSMIKFCNRARACSDDNDDDDDDLVCLLTYRFHSTTCSKVEQTVRVTCCAVLSVSE